MHNNLQKSPPTVPGDLVERSMSRRHWLGVAAGGAILFVTGQGCGRGETSRIEAAQGTPAPGGGSVATPVATQSPSSLPTVTMYKDPNCGCCAKWGEHMRGAGFTVNEHNTSDMPSVKKEQGVPERLYSCHTAIVGAYVVEGHVPADLVQKMLTERPQIRGLSAPGMPQSSPGMDIGNEKYEVISFTGTGETAVYAVRP